MLRVGQMLVGPSAWELPSALQQKLLERDECREPLPSSCACPAAQGWGGGRTQCRALPWRRM